MTPQKPNRRKCRETAIKVLYSQFFTSTEMSKAVTGVQATETIQDFKETLSILAEYRRAIEATERALSQVVDRFADIVRNSDAGNEGGARKAPKKLDEGTVDTRLHLLRAQAEARVKIKELDRIIAESDPLYDEKGFTVRLLKTFDKNRDRIQDIIERALEGWRLERLTAEDGAMLRLGATELLHFNDVPTKAIINEYLELSKIFGDKESSGLVNAVLDRIAKENPRTEDKG